MNKIILILIGLFLIQNLNSQTYNPFPTDTAQWNCLTKAQWSPSDIFYVNSQYQIRGDTNIESTSYKKVYYQNSDYPTQNSEYIGGLREDINKNVFFFPSMTHIPNYCASEFPSDTTEYLLYTFDSLEPGMILPINSEVVEIEVLEIDSVLLNGIFRKRYKVEQGSLFGPDYWIEGIGSTKDLFAPFSEEFEWELFTLCYTDTLTYFINSPNGEDSCHYWLPTGINYNESEDFIIYPNPTSQTIIINFKTEIEYGTIQIFNTSGQIVHTSDLRNTKTQIDINNLENGIYIIEVIGKNRTIRKIIKN